jgi:hypothetical protein
MTRAAQQITLGHFRSNLGFREAFHGSNIPEFLGGNPVIKLEPTERFTHWSLAMMTASSKDLLWVDDREKSRLDTSIIYCVECVRLSVRVLLERLFEVTKRALKLALLDFGKLPADGEFGEGWNVAPRGFVLGAAIPMRKIVVELRQDSGARGADTSKVSKLICVRLSLEFALGVCLRAARFALGGVRRAESRHLQKRAATSTSLDTLACCECTARPTHTSRHLEVPLFSTMLDAASRAFSGHDGERHFILQT